MTRALTERQLEIYNAIVDYWEEKGTMPTLREICAHFGMASTRAATDHVNALVRKGYLQKRKDVSRGISLAGPRGSAMKVASQGYSLPLIGSVAAGMPTMAVEEESDRFVVDRSISGGQDSFMLEVKGESMIEDHICPGDYIVVQRQDHAKDGDVVVALLDDEDATVKRLERKGNKIRLIPANARLSPIPVPDPSRLRILGIVTGLVRRMR